MNLELELDDLDALLESRYEHDLEHEIQELENENLETFGVLSLEPIEPKMMTMQDVEKLLTPAMPIMPVMPIMPIMPMMPMMGERVQVMTAQDVEILLKKESMEKSKIEFPKKQLGTEKEKKTRVHLEKIHRPSQSARRKTGNLQNNFFKKDNTTKIYITHWEKELIAKIQISQLVSDDPWKNDFYCKVYSLGLSKSIQTRGKKKSGVNKIQAQMTRLIEKNKSRQVKGPKTLEGALGKISVLSSRNPRQVLDLVSSQVEKSKVEFTLSRKSVLNSIERVYDNVLELEAIKRSETPEILESRFQVVLKELWENLALDCQVSYSLPHPFGFFLKFSKGIKVIPRLLKFLNSEQQFSLFSTLMCRLECVEIANLPVGLDRREIDAFMTYVIPVFVDYVSEIGLDVVNSLMKTILERHNMVWVATSKIGLAFLTAFLSRAELLKQGETPNENDLALWNDIFNFLFSSIQGSFSSLFPSQTSDQTESLPGEIYIWQFLASLAVCATSVDQQTTLVSEVRHNIIATAKMTTDPKALANVDLFLAALGLGIDASQLASSV